ncbi:MAG: heme ABC exporter ATP-binding protein CcmA [Gammaproteobacteria bacterium]|nr:heme ABC exporter ATP-binding protein CcmA [Gammaproteobacteria bacterium]NNM00846.1 heme ABC exporter ATP-binding protein CcmA [Gammaproteobacteria bacterium]
MTAEALTVSDVAIERGGRRLLASLSFTLADGELAIAQGPNGSGKTTLLRALAGLAPPASGRIEFAGRSLYQAARAGESPVIYTGHAEGLKAELTVRENLSFYRALWESGADIASAIERIGIGHCADRSVGELSAGQRRRASLARVLLSSARIWILDEPFTNLDGDGRSLIVKLVGEHLGRGGLVVIASHLTGEFADQVAVTIAL